MSRILVIVACLCVAGTCLGAESPPMVDGKRVSILSTVVCTSAVEFSGLRLGFGLLEDKTECAVLRGFAVSPIRHPRFEADIEWKVSVMSPGRLKPVAYTTARTKLHIPKAGTLTPFYMVMPAIKGRERGLRPGEFIVLRIAVRTWHERSDCDTVSGE